MDSRSPLVKEAQTLRDLGRYPDAEIKYREALKDKDDLVVRIELAAMFIEQGCARKCKDEIAPSRAVFSRDEAGSPAAALADMLYRMADSATSLLFSESIEAAAAMYTSLLQNFPVADYKNLEVCLDKLLTTYLS